jgi:hypothetical protein
MALEMCDPTHRYVCVFEVARIGKSSDQNTKYSKFFALEKRTSWKFHYSYNFVLVNFPIVCVYVFPCVYEQEQ